MRSIDLNCDIGEGMSNDRALMKYVSSVNIACGYHAGNKGIMQQTVEWALENNCAIGAHPSYPDTENFGRLDILDKTVSRAELPGLIADQIELLEEVCREAGTSLHHIKPHGALYNRAAVDEEVSAIICRVIRNFNPDLILYGLSGSVTKKIAEIQDVKFVNEVFADRTYLDDGRLTPRTEAGSLIEDQDSSLHQVLQMILEHTVTSVRGKRIPLEAETICIHGDGAHALEFAAFIHQALNERGIEIRSV